MSKRYPLLSEAQWRGVFRLPPEQGRPQETEESQRPTREVARLRQENAKLQAEIKRLKTPPPKEPPAPEPPRADFL